MNAVNHDKLNVFIGQMLADLGGAFSVPLVRIGDRLGLYRIMHEKGPMTPAELAKASGCNLRYLREWLSAQAASNYIGYDPVSGAFLLSPEQAMVFADDGSSVRLVSAWLPALDGVLVKLERGARVADIGCGHGVSTVLMAEAFPNSTFIGYDFHGGSIAEANDHARSHGVGNVSFEVGLAKDFAAAELDLVTCFDCLHDMGDPEGAAAHIRQALKPGGTWMIVEPMAQDTLEANLNPVGRLFYSASTMICVPTSLAQETRAALGAQAGEARLRKAIFAGGFATVRRAAETPFHMILEAVA